MVTYTSLFIVVMLQYLGKYPIPSIVKTTISGRLLLPPSTVTRIYEYNSSAEVGDSPKLAGHVPATETR
jgi:hypothetical protein